MKTLAKNYLCYQQVKILNSIWKQEADRAGAGVDALLLRRNLKRFRYTLECIQPTV